MPAGAVGVALVAAQHSYRPETHRRVAADRRLVVCCRVDRQTVVAPVTHQVAHQRADSVTAHTPSVHDGVEEDVEGGVPIHDLLLFAVLHHSAHRPVKQYGEPGGGRVVEGP